MQTEPTRVRPSSVRQVTIVGIVTFALFTVMNAPSLRRVVERQPFGWQRTLELAVVKPVESVGDTLRLTAPRHWADDALGHEFGDASAFEELTAAEPVEPERDPTALPAATAADPLKVWVIGDSQAEILGQSVIAKADATGVMEAELDFHFSSGLTRPDFFNWPGEIQTIVEQDQPDVMVVVFGANDAQGMELEGGVFQPGDAEWNAEYARRVDAVMSYLENQGIRVYWMGQPIARDAGYSERMRILNEIFEEQAAAHPNTTYLSLYELFEKEDGGYGDYLPGADGQLVRMRNPDGIHLTRAGGDLAANEVFEILDADLP
jgi:hypothetical protein